MRLVRGESSHGGASSGESIPKDVIFSAREEIQQVKPQESVERYMVALIEGTRYPERYGEDLKSWISLGGSPRGSLALDKASRVRAWLEGRDYVRPDDVQAVAHGVLRHRVTLSYEAQAEGITTDKVIDELLKQVAVG